MKSAFTIYASLAILALWTLGMMFHTVAVTIGSSLPLPH